MDETSNLDELKEKYGLLREKYNLPEFDKLNSDFGIEKASDVETDYLIREIRKFVADRFYNYLKIIETVLQPANAPLFILSIVRLIEQADKEKLFKIYGKLAKKEVEILQLDLEFSEEKEAEFVKESYFFWQGIKEYLSHFFKKVEDNWEHKPIVNGKNYFG